MPSLQSFLYCQLSVLTSHFDSMELNTFKRHLKTHFLTNTLIRKAQSSASVCDLTCSAYDTIKTVLLLLFLSVLLILLTAIIQANVGCRPTCPCVLSAILHNGGPNVILRRIIMEHDVFHVLEYCSIVALLKQYGFNISDRYWDVQ